MLTVPSSLSNLLAHLISYSFSFICLAENLPSLLPGLSTLTPGTLQNTWFFLGLVLLQVHYRVHGFFRTRFTLGTLQSTWFFRTRFTPGALQSTWFIQDQVYSRYTIEYMVFQASFTPSTLEYMFFQDQVYSRYARVHVFFQDKFYSGQTREHMVFFRTRFTPGTLEYIWFYSGLGLLQVHQSTCFFAGLVIIQVTGTLEFMILLGLIFRYTREHVFFRIRFTPGTLEYMVFILYQFYSRLGLLQVH